MLQMHATLSVSIFILQEAEFADLGREELLEEEDVAAPAQLTMAGHVH